MGWWWIQNVDCSSQANCDDVVLSQAFKPACFVSSNPSAAAVVNGGVVAGEAEKCVFDGARDDIMMDGGGEERELMQSGVKRQGMSTLCGQRPGCDGKLHYSRSPFFVAGAPLQPFTWRRESWEKLWRCFTRLGQVTWSCCAMQRRVMKYALLIVLQNTRHVFVNPIFGEASSVAVRCTTQGSA